MAIIRLFIGLIVVFYTIYTPIYVIFFDDGEDAVESFSLADAFVTSQRTIIDSKSDLKEIKSWVKDFASKYEEVRDIDIRMPIHKALKKCDDVDGVKIIREMSHKGGSLYLINFKYKNKEKSIGFAVEEASFFNMRQAKAHCIEPIDIIVGNIGPVYGMSKDDIIRTIQMLHKSLGLPD